MTVIELHHCQAERSRSGGELAQRGRAKLRTALTQRAAPCGCGYARCRPEPLTDIEAQRALRHVSNRHAVAYALGEVVLVGSTTATAAAAGCRRSSRWR